MTQLLNETIARVRELPPNQQDRIAEAVLIDVAASDLAPYVLTDEEMEAVEEGLAQAARGELASDEEVAAMWRRFGLVRESGTRCAPCGISTRFVAT